VLLIVVARGMAGDGKQQEYHYQLKIES